MKRAQMQRHGDLAAPDSVRLEREALLAARRPRNDARPDLRDGFTPREQQARLSGGRGAPLPGDLRARMEHRMGRDFSMVRVHNDAEAARLAEASGANAVAYGSDIAFAPGAWAPHSASGTALLAHELAHVGQQQSMAEPMAARDAKTGQGGIGDAPSSERAIPMEGAGSEDTHALFQVNSADLASGAAGTMLTELGKIEGPVTVHVHGYASREGDATWNYNLSTHRAAAAKAALEKLLPEGSRVVLFAHGGTADFGKREDNRRVGVSLMGPVQSFGFKLKAPSGPYLQFDPNPQPKSDAPLLDASKPLLPQLGIGGIGGISGIAGIGGIAGPRNSLGPVVPPPLVPRQKMDLAAMSAGMASHGISPGAFGDVVSLWDAAFLRYRAMGLNDDWAARLANSQISGTLSSQAARDAPNAIDRANADWAAAHPEESKTPIISVDPRDVAKGVKSIFDKITK
jgi:outer membrane protein OmpA-like peptidoglycan-associated protein